ncbi:MAG: site-specific DNA-methyltransferase [Coriobacteriales bacterium]|nr:site-specific DNA-methyltransferase [Coriobacteriales bacterium]
MAIEYVPYFPTTIEGQALLGNFVRTQRLLRYRDNDRIVRSVQRGMPLYETTLQETVGDASSENMVIRGECLSACAFLKKRIDAGEMPSINLVYIDPPFASGADYAKQVYIRRNPKLAEEARRAEAQLDDEELRSFEEVMYGDIWDKERYLNWMHENLLAIKAVMSPNASIYVHLDYHIGAYVKVLLDEVFGESAFQSEIIWKRSSAHSDSAGFANIHDSIFYYALGESFYFDTPYVPYTDEYIKSHYKHKDADGRLYKDGDLSAKGLSGGGYTYTWKGKEGYWRCPITTMERYEAEGRIYYTRNGTPRIKQYLDEMPGMPAQDLWTDIFPVNSQAAERVDYATQKPEALLQRIIEASSDEGMLVADFFGGSGTTAAVCAKTGRHFIHADVGVNSIQTTRERLLEIGDTSFSIYEVRDGVSLYRNPAQTMDKLKVLIPGLTNEDSLDSFWEGAFSTAEGMVPVYIPNLTDSTTKFLDKVLAMRIINEAMPDLPEGTKKVVVFYVDIVDEAQMREFIDEHNDTGMDIELRDLKPLLADVVAEDEFTYELSEDGSSLLEPWRTSITSFTSDRLEGKIYDYNAKGALQGKQSFKPICVSEEGLELIECVSLDCTAAEGPWHADAEVYIDRNGFQVVDGRATDQFWDGSVSSERPPLRIRVRNIAGDETVSVVQPR